MVCMHDVILELAVLEDYKQGCRKEKCSCVYISKTERAVSIRKYFPEQLVQRIYILYSTAVPYFIGTHRIGCFSLKLQKICCPSLAKFSNGNATPLHKDACDACM